jgi:uncharacterized membrane protein
MNLLRRYIIFTAFAATTIAVGGALTLVIPPATALLGGFNCGTLLFLVLLYRRYSLDTAQKMRSRAAANEPDHHTLLAIALFVVAVVLTAVWVELSGRDGRDTNGIILAAVTLSLAWVFANCLFALHSAHVWYLGGDDGDRGGLTFPGEDKTPDYWDFTYFAFVLGMTFQVSDIVITSKRMRKLALLHALLAFLFNIAVIALSVSLVAAALGG